MSTLSVVRAAIAFIVDQLEEQHAGPDENFRIHLSQPTKGTLALRLDMHRLEGPYLNAESFGRIVIEDAGLDEHFVCSRPLHYGEYTVDDGQLLFRFPEVDALVVAHLDAFVAEWERGQGRPVTTPRHALIHTAEPFELAA